jgi:hypothetical protein
MSSIKLNVQLAAAPLMFANFSFRVMTLARWTEGTLFAEGF